MTTLQAFGAMLNECLDSLEAMHLGDYGNERDIATLTEALDHADEIARILADAETEA